MYRIIGTCAVVLGLGWTGSAWAGTTVVSPAGLGPWQTLITGSDGNPVADTNGSITFSPNPPGAPAGQGSVTLDTGPNHGDSAVQLLDQGLAGTPLAAIATGALSYSTLSKAVDGAAGKEQLPYLTLTLDTTGDGLADDTIVFEPLYQHGNRVDLPDQGPIQIDVWQHWNAAAGGWWSTSGTLAGATPGFGVKSLAEILAAAPGARIVAARTGPGGLRVLLGVRNTLDHLIASVDALTVDTGAGPQTFDFEPGIAPVLGQSVVVGRARGTVYVRTAHGLTKLRKGVRVRLGSFLDATRGRVSLTSANDRHGSLQSGVFYGGAFKVRQRGVRKPITEARLSGPIGRCPSTSGAKAHARSATVRRGRHLWGDSHGNFRTVGKSSSASTRGTKWLIEDRCNGTITRVVRGTVVVHDFATGYVHAVTAGHSYLAPSG